jgi:hypothetical protein
MGKKEQQIVVQAAVQWLPFGDLRFYLMYRIPCGTFGTTGNNRVKNDPTHFSIICLF